MTRREYPMTVAEFLYAVGPSLGWRDEQVHAYLSCVHCGSAVQADACECGDCGASL